MNPPAQDPRLFDDRVPPDLPPAHALGERPHRPCQAVPQEGRGRRAHRGAGDHVLAHRAGHRPGGREVRRLGGGRRGGRAELLRAHDHRPVRAQLADPHERGPAAGPAVGVLRAAGRGRALERVQRHLRHPARDGAGAPVRGRHRLLLLAPAPRGRHRAVHHGGGVGSRVVHAPLRRLDRGGQAGRHAPGRQHGHPARRPPRHPRVHHLQERHLPGHQLQHLGRDHRRLHARGARGRRVRPGQPRAATGSRAARRRARSST